MVRLLVLVVLLLGGRAHAGAWMLEPGSGFFSISAESSAPYSFPDGYELSSSFSSFVEYGVSENLTIGYDVTISSSLDKAIAYLRLPIRQEDGKMRYVFETGAGMRNSNPAVYAGLMAGRGVKVFGKPGWFMMENRYVYDTSDGILDAKLDFTLGFTMDSGHKVLGQLMMEKATGQDFAAKAQASIAWALQPGTFLETGVNVGLIDNKSVGLKIGLWRQW